MKLRAYQKECLDQIKNKKNGSYLIQMATGLGKTYTFAQLEDVISGRILIISHTKELVKQPEKYFKSSFGIEQGKQQSKGDERIISATRKTMVNRLHKFFPWDFEIIIIDEAHHAPAQTYLDILDYFDPRLVLGFTATPNRGDKIGLDTVFKQIIFEKSLKWGIQNNYLSDITCKLVNIKYDLKGVRSNKKDFTVSQLNEAVNIEEANKSIAEAYEKHAVGQTLIFCCSVDHCYKVSELIPGSKVIDGKTKSEERDQILKDFENRVFKVLINCLVFTEGTDLPLIETVIIARPTKNASLYTQMVGRGVRLHPDKEYLTLIDCVGINASICTAPTLLGLKTESVPESRKNEIEGDLFDLESIIDFESDCPETWIKNVQIVNIWANDNEYNTHDVNYHKMANGDLVLSPFKKGMKKIVIKKPDELGFTIYNGKTEKIQDVFDRCFVWLRDNFYEEIQLWNTEKIKQWGRVPATESQLKIINKRLPKFDTSKLKKGEASQLITKLFMEGK